MAHNLRFLHKNMAELGHLKIMVKRKQTFSLRKK